MENEVFVVSVRLAPEAASGCQASYRVVEGDGGSWAVPLPLTETYVG